MPDENGAWQRDTQRTLNSILSNQGEMKGLLAAIKTDLNDHETRVRTLERGYYKVLGAAATVSALVSVAVICIRFLFYLS